METYIQNDLSIQENIDAIEKVIVNDLGDRSSYDIAINDYSKLLICEPFNSMLYRNRGHRYLSISEFDKAVADLIMSTRLFPDYWKNWNYIGMIYYFKGEYEKSILYYNRAMLETGVDSPFYVAMVNWKYLALMKLGRNSEANDLINGFNAPKKTLDNYRDLVYLYRGTLSVEEIEKKLKEDINEIYKSTYCFGLGMYYYFNGHKEKSVNLFKDFINSSDVWFALGYMGVQAELKRI